MFLWTYLRNEKRCFDNFEKFLDLNNMLLAFQSAFCIFYPFTHYGDNKKLKFV